MVIVASAGGLGAFSSACVVAAKTKKANSSARHGKRILRAFMEISSAVKAEAR